MTPTPREQIASLLGDVTAPGSFSARRTAPVDDLDIEVKGLGRLRFPVPTAQARELCRLARPARYGKGTETLHDRRVRDTWEVPLSRVKIDKRRWNQTLLPVLDGIRADLGLPVGVRLTAELHSMLVYTAGQFFVPHQDSERADNMVASLVVTLPAPFTGGSLVVEHRGHAATYRSSKQALSFVAFFSDCHHEIRPVRSGHRIVLTYNLVLKGGGPSADAGAPPETVETVAASLHEHFETPPGQRWSGDTAAPPNRLVYLLDHQYTERGLSWARLKGDDAVRVATLRAAAEYADCDLVLALADVHETWDCFEDDWDRGSSRQGRYRSWDDDEDDEDDDDDEDVSDGDGYELGELVDWGITLDHWLDPSGGQGEPIAATVSDAEVCATTPTATLQPYSSEYEGYMGNYGNTMDRWYRRAAVVVWPRQRAFAVHAEGSAEWAVSTLREELRTGDPATVRETASTVAPFWDAVARDATHRSFAADVMRVATGLEDPALALMLLAPFDVEMLTPGNAASMVALVEQYGYAWADALVARWSGRRWRLTGEADRSAWVAALAKLGKALVAVHSATGAATARLVLDHTCTWLAEQVKAAGDLLPPSHRAAALGDLAPPFLGFLTATAVTGAEDLRDRAVGSVCADENDEAMLALAIRVLRNADATIADPVRARAGLDMVAEHCVQQLQSRLARPARADDDWSLDAPSTCGCDVCAKLGMFLADAAQRRLEWPLAKDGRTHVHRTVDASELPVRHETKRTGRPYTLVLTKTDAVIERDRQARRRDETDLAWLLQRGR